MPTTNHEFTYDVALSFAGEDRAYAEELAALLQTKGIKVFYDRNETADLWGKDLIAHLADVYGNQARFCVMLVSRHYPLKRWTRHERQHAQARASRDLNEYILPLKLDDTEIPGLADTIGYIDLRRHSLEDVAALLKEKIAHAKATSGGPSVPQPIQPGGNQPSAASIPLPEKKRVFTQLEKDRFAREAFVYVRDYFRQGLQELRSKYSDVDIDFTEVTALKFTCRIYAQGNLAAQCAIWLGDSLTPNSIYYSEARRSFEQENSFNDYLSVEESGGQLRLRIGLMAVGMVQPEERLATSEQAARYLWMRLTRSLESH
jgi:hypothetical protein